MLFLLALDFCFQKKVVDDQDTNNKYIKSSGYFAVNSTLLLEAILLSLIYD